MVLRRRSIQTATPSTEKRQPDDDGENQEVRHRRVGSLTTQITATTDGTNRRMDPDAGLSPSQCSMSCRSAASLKVAAATSFDSGGGGLLLVVRVTYSP